MRSSRVSLACAFFRNLQRGDEMLLCQSRAHAPLTHCERVREIMVEIVALRAPARALFAVAEHAIRDVRKAPSSERPQPVLVCVSPRSSHRHASPHAGWMLPIGSCCRDWCAWKLVSCLPLKQLRRLTVSSKHDNMTMAKYP